MENLYCNLKCVYCGTETPLATSATGHKWDTGKNRKELAAFVRSHGNCYLLDHGKPTGNPFTLSYGAKKESGVPTPGELPLTEAQRAWFDEFKRQRQEA